MVDKQTRSSKKIPAHYGMNEYYSYFCKKNPNLNISRAKFNKVITEYNKLLGESLIEDLTIRLPFRLGKIEILKQLRKRYLNDDGKLINTNPVNWKKTNELWELDEEAKNKKILIRFDNRHTGGYVFRIFYNKSNAIYKNKRLYFFQPIRTLKRSISTRINDYSKSKYDTFIKQ